MSAIDVYEIRRSGVTICAGSVPNLGYSAAILRDMEKAGLHLYRNGKKEKLPPVVRTRKAASEK